MGNQVLSFRCFFFLSFFLFPVLTSLSSPRLETSTSAVDDKVTSDLSGLVCEEADDVKWIEEFNSDSELVGSEDPHSDGGTVCMDFSSLAVRIPCFEKGVARPPNLI